MTQLKVKTRGGSSPQGKQKVYFCCHPAEFAAFFEPITEEILAKQNCAVWYDDTGAPRDVEFLDQLQEMQLFVMPVTSRLLYTPNPALEVEFPFAVAHHIPILPLMQERGLETSFNETCGNLQFLDKLCDDPTALPYDEKLEKFLSGVLVGDALAEKVRAAFDAYVFLSYRKKDRKHAQELMRLIHQNDFCRDIAIWYDEFLTPGENFNEAIRAALEKSGLFVLTVTPNLVNEKNYIMTTEYPMAAEQSKPMVPAEMVPTDRAALADKYPAIPPVADAHDGQALSAALLEAVRKLAIEENDHSPEHNFFIGLAYLNGIDVEVDHPRAVSLITGAAEAGLAEAAQKLVEMYRNGVGVQRDYEKAIRWQEKLIAIREKEYADSIGKETDDIFLSLEDIFGSDCRIQSFTLNNLFWSLIESGRFYHEMRQLLPEKKAYEKALHYLESFPYDKTSEGMLNKYFVCYRCLGDSCRHLTDADGAEAYYEKSLQALEANTGKRKEDYSVDLSVIHNRLGLCFADKRDWKKARYYHEKQLEHDEETANRTGTVLDRANLATCYVNLGDVCDGEGDLDAAHAYYEQALRIRMQLAEETERDEECLELASTYFRLGDVEVSRKRYAEALDYYQTGLTLGERISDKLGTVDSRQCLAIEYGKLGHLFFCTKEWAAARQYRERSLAIYLCLAEEVKTAEMRNCIRDCCESLKRICKKLEDLAGYRTSYAQVAATLERVAKATNTVQTWRAASSAYLKMGLLYEEDRDLEAAKEWFEKALHVCERIMKQTKQMEDQRDTMRCLNWLARIYREQEDYVAAKEYYLRYLEIARSVKETVGEADTDEAHRAYSDVRDCCWRLATVCEKLGQQDEAQRYRDEEAALRKAAEDIMPTTLESLDALFDD